MPMRNAISLIAAYALALILGSGLFVWLYRTDLLRSHTLLFNRVLWFLIPVSLAAAALFELARRNIPAVRDAATGRDAWIIFLVLFLGNWNVYGMIPFNVSRSNSIILVGYLAASESTPRTEREIVEAVNDLYINRYRAIQRRIEEQLALGNVEHKGDGYVLTAKGRSTVWLMNTVTNWFRMDNNFLNADLYRPEAGRQE